ncbi:MAG: hemolysin family protein [Methanimicrococcus sp.]|nr:hemolysin family protein [Methanimicrococcus sp.]
MAYMELFIIFLLIFLSGLLSLSEAAVLSSRKSRLKSAAKSGKAGAQKALDFIENPSSFLSAVQIGVTSISVFIGIYAGAFLSQDLAEFFLEFETLQPYAVLFSVLISVLGVTYLLIVFGVLIPKKIGQSYPEFVASLVSRALYFFSVLISPISWFVNGSSNLISKLAGIKPYEPETTEEDVIAVVQEGIDGGAIDETEQDLVERIFSLDDRKVSSLITHKNDLVSIDIAASQENILKTVNETPYSIYPVTDGNIDVILGVLSVKDLISEINRSDFNIKNVIRPANFLPDNMTILSVLEMFRENQNQHAFITDEFGSIIGLVTISDIFEALVGDTALHPSEDDYEITPRASDSWLIDGQYPFYDFLEYFDLMEYRNDYPYNTLSGMILDIFGKIPRASDKFDWLHYEIEVVDMDNARIDKVLMTEKSLSEETAGD